MIGYVNMIQLYYDHFLQVMLIVYVFLTKEVECSEWWMMVVMMVVVFL